MKRSWINWVEWLLVAALVAMAGYGIWVGVDQKIAAKSIYEMGVSPARVELAVGESVQLTAIGYLKDGSLADPEVVEKVDYYWEARMAEGIFTLDKATGTVTAIAPGEATVDVHKKGGNIGSPYFCTVTVVE